MGKASVRNITVPLGYVVVPKALGMARLSPAASLLAILPPSSSRFCPLAPYCYHPPPGWHPTAHHLLAPYCYSPAGTLLLLTGWQPTAHRRCLASPLPGGSARLPTSLPPAIYSTVANLALVTVDHGIALPPWSLLNADASPPSGQSRPLTHLPLTATSRGAFWLGILAIVVVSRRFLDSFLSVTWGPAEGFGSLCCTFL